MMAIERPFRGARQRLRSKLGGLDCSTWLSVDGLLGFPASSNARLVRDGDLPDAPPTPDGVERWYVLDEESK